MQRAARSHTRVAVMVSGHGRGSNMQAIIDACADGRIAANVVLVIGATGDAPAMERARSQRIRTAVVSSSTFKRDSAGYGDAILAQLRQDQVDLVCLAGYMRLLPANVVAEHRYRIMNVHPGLLPLFGGRGMYGHHVHDAVLASGMKVSGCTVHYVDDQYDHGPIILQTPVPVMESDTADTLAARILPHEHATYVEATRLHCLGRLLVEANRVHVLDADV